MTRIAVIAATLVACSGSRPTPAPAVPIDAPPIDGVTTIGTFDPASGMHLDDDVHVSGGGGSGTARPGKGARAGRPIEVTLRSTPGGAIARVDGQEVGPTPAFWEGEANGHEHEFTFTLRGHFTARYRFVPVSSGVVHARLERNGVDDVAAPAAGSSAVKPPPAPQVDAPPPVAPPPTLVSPAVDAAVAPSDAS